MNSVATMNQFQNDSSTQLDVYKNEYEVLKNAYNQTDTSNTERRNALRSQMNTLATNINTLQKTQIAVYDVAVKNEEQARTNLGQQLGTLGVLDKQLQNIHYNIGVLNQDDINKAKMADININESKEYEAQMQLFKMISFYLVLILFFGILGKYVPPITNITKIICVITTLIMIFHIFKQLRDMYNRSSINYDEYNFKKPKHTASNDSDDDTDDSDDESDNDSNCKSKDDIVNHSTDGYSNIKPYNNRNKSVLGKSKF